MNQIPNQFPAVATDKAAFCLNVAEEMVIHLEMAFDNPLDEDRLAQALDLLLDAEPILGCRLKIKRGNLCWERLEGEKRQNFIRADSSEQFETFLTRHHRPDQGPLLKACLWQDGRKNRLLLKMAHEAADAGAVKELATSLGNIYRQLSLNPKYRPQPNLHSRGIWQVLRRISWRHYPRLCFNHLKMRQVILKTRGFGLPVEGAFGGKPFYRLRHLPDRQVARLVRYGRQRKATINDLMLTAYLRAIAQTGGWDGTARLQATTTIDLRRHLPDGKAKSIANFSAIDPFFVHLRPQADFDEMLARVRRETSRRKSNMMGLAGLLNVLPIVWLLPAAWSAAILRPLFLPMLRRTGIYNSMTNMGPIRPEHVTFDKPASSAWLIVPPQYPPGLLLGLSGYRETLTLSAGSYGPAVTPEFLDGLFDTILAQLPV